MTTIYRSTEGERLVKEAYAGLLSHWPVPHETLRLPTREGETFVVASGAAGKPPLVLLHGAMSNSAAWMAHIATWSSRFRTYAVDLIGEPGFSAPARPSLASPAYAAWLDDVLDRLALDEVAIAGISLGGWLALDYAIRRPGRATKLALMCPGGIGRTKGLFKLKALLLASLGSWGRRQAAASVAGRAKLPPQVISYLGLLVEHVRPRLEPLPIFGDEALRGISAPVFVAVGGKDALLDSRETLLRVAAAVPDARIRYLPNAGHVIIGQAAPVLDFLGAGS
jgi:pimeloyl-ACP methyl ester carboxylesterase